MADAKPESKNIEPVDDQGQESAKKPPEIVRMDDPDANKTFIQAKQKENAQASPETAGKKEEAAILGNVSISKPQEDPKKDQAKSLDADKDNSGKNDESEDRQWDRDPICPFHHLGKFGYRRHDGRGDNDDFKLRNTRLEQDGSSPVHLFHYANVQPFSEFAASDNAADSGKKPAMQMKAMSASVDDAAAPAETKSQPAVSPYKSNRTYSEYEQRGWNQVNYYSSKVSSAFGTMWNGAKNLVGLGDKKADAPAEPAPEAKKEAPKSAREQAEATATVNLHASSAMMLDSVSEEIPTDAGAGMFKPAARTLPEDIGAALQNKMSDGHDYAFLDRMDEKTRTDWLKSHQDKQDDYNRYERLVKAGYYGEVDQLSPDLKKVWLDRASDDQKKAYQKYQDQINAGDYSSFDKIGKVPTDVTDPKKRAEIESDYKHIYENLSPEQRQGVDQYNDVRNAIKSSHNGDYKELADLAGTKPPNKSLDLWLKTASPEERQAFANTVIDRQLSASTRAEDTKSWYENASSEQKKVFFDGLQKRTDAEKDSWWDKVSNPQATKENPWSAAQKDYLNDRVARDNGAKDGALDKNADKLSKISAADSQLTNKERLQTGDYSKADLDYSRLSKKEREDLAKQVHDDPSLSKEDKDAFSKMSKEDQALAAYLKKIDAPGQNLAERLDNYKIYVVNEKSGYPSYVDRMNGTQLKEWLQEASPSQRQNYADYMDAKAAGDYSFINGDNFDYFRKNNYGGSEWQNYRQFRERVDAGDFTFLENLHGRNTNNIFSYARYSDADYQKYADFKLKQEAGDYSFISKQSADAQKNWYEHASKADKAAFDAYKEDLLSGNFSSVEDYLAAKVKPPVTIEQAREEWKKENAGLTLDGKPYDITTKYDAYVKELTIYRTQSEDFRKLDRMTPEERSRWFETHSNEKDGYHDWQVKNAVGDFGWVDRLPAKDHAELLKRYDEKTGDLKEEGAAFRAYSERMESGDYSHIYMMDKDYYHKWKDNASPEQLAAYLAYVDRMSAGDFSYVDRYSDATKKDWQNRLDKLNPDLHKGEKDGLEDFRTNSNLWRKDLDDGYKIYQKRIAAGDWSMIDNLKNDDNWNDFAINSTAEQWKAYTQYKDAISKGDYSFVDRLRDLNVPGATESPFSAWLTTASAADKRAYLEFYNKQAGVTPADKTTADDKLNDLITNLARPASVSNAGQAGVPVGTAGGDLKPGTDTGTGVGLPKSPEPGTAGNIPTDIGKIHPVPTSGSDPVVGKPGSDPVVGKPGSDPVVGKPGSDPVVGKPGSDPVVGKPGSDPVVGKPGADPVVGKPGSDPVVGSDHVATGTDGSVTNSDTAPAANEQGDKNQKAYDEFLRKLQNAKDEKERGQLLNTVSKDSASIKAIADYIVSHPSSPDLLREISQSKNPRDLATTTFIKSLEQQNPEIKEIREQARLETPSRPGPLPAPSLPAKPGDSPAKPGDPKQDPPPPDPKPAPATGTPNPAPGSPQNPGSPRARDPFHGDTNLEPKLPAPPPIVNPAPITPGGTPAPGGVQNPPLPAEPTKPGTTSDKNGNRPTTPEPGGSLPPVIPGQGPGPLPSPGTPIGNSQPGNPQPGNPQPGNPQPGNPQPGNPQLPPVLPRPTNPDVPTTLTGQGGQTPGGFNPFPSTNPGQPSGLPAPVTPQGNSETKLGRNESLDIYKEQIRRNPSEYQPPGGGDRPQAPQQAPQQNQGPAPVTPSGNLPVVVPVDKPNAPVDRTQPTPAPDLSRQSTPTGDKNPADGKGGQASDGRSGNPLPAQPVDQKQADSSQAGAAGQKPGTVDGASPTGQRERGTVSGDVVALPAKLNPDGTVKMDAAGRVLDPSGKVVDASGRVLDAAGRPVDATGRLVDAAGRPVDAAGRLVDAAGRPVDAVGRDAAGRQIDAAGKPIDAAGRDSAGRPIDAAGRVIDVAGRVLDAAGRPIADAGRGGVVDVPGRTVEAGKVNLDGSKAGTADGVGNVRPGDQNASRLPDLSATGKSVDGRQQGEVGRIDGKPVVIGADQSTGRPIDLPGSTKGAGDLGNKDKDGKPGFPGIPEKGMPVSSEQTPVGKGQPGIAGGITGGIMMPGGKGESGKTENGSDISEGPGGKPSAKDPGIGLSQLGQGSSSTPGQKPTQDPQGAGATAGGSAVPLQPINLPTVQITGQDPKGVDPKGAAASADPKGTGANADPKGAGANADPKAAGANVDPKATGANADPKAAGANVDPKAAGANVDPKAAGANADPKAAGANADPKTAGASADPKTAGANADPKAAANADPKAASAKPDDKNSIPETKTNESKAEQKTGLNNDKKESSKFVLGIEMHVIKPHFADQVSSTHGGGHAQAPAAKTNEESNKGKEHESAPNGRPSLEQPQQNPIPRTEPVPQNSGRDLGPQLPVPAQQPEHGSNIPDPFAEKNPGPTAPRPTSEPEPGTHGPRPDTPDQPSHGHHPDRGQQTPDHNHGPQTPSHETDHRPQPSDPNSNQGPPVPPPAQEPGHVPSIPAPAPDAGHVPANPGHTPDAGHVPANPGHTPDAGHVPANPGPVPDAGHVPANPGPAPDAGHVPANPGPAPDAGHVPANPGHAPDAGHVPANPGPAPDAGHVPANPGPASNLDPGNIFPPGHPGPQGQPENPGHEPPHGGFPSPGHIPTEPPSGHLPDGPSAPSGGIAQAPSSEEHQPNPANVYPSSFGAEKTPAHNEPEQKKETADEASKNTPVGIFTEMYIQPQLAVHHPEPQQVVHAAELDGKHIPTLQEQLAEDARLLQSDSFAPAANSTRGLEGRVDVAEQIPLPEKMSPDMVSSVQGVTQFIVQAADHVPSLVNEDRILDRVEQSVDEAINKFIHGGDPNAAMTPAQLDAIKIVSSLIAGPADELNAAEEFTHLGAKFASDLGLGTINSITPNDVISQALGLSEPDPIAQIEADILSSIIPDSKKDELDEERIKQLSEKERRDYDEHLREEEARRYAAAMLAALKARQAQEETNRIRAQKDLLNVEARQKYIVMQGDTLELIAQKRLLNKRLAPLIYEINKSRIPIKVKEGKRLLQLKPKLVILLPTQIEIRRFQTRLFGKNTDRFEYDHSFEEGNSKASSLQPLGPRNNTGNSSATEMMPLNMIPPRAGSNKDAEVPVDRRANVEALLGKISEAEDEGRIKYMCRLGDTLRAIAMRHPALNDVNLWQLLARLNKLSTETNESGNPVVELKRGQQIILPLPREIAEFRRKQKHQEKTEGRQEASTEARISGKPCPGCGKIAALSSQFCTNCAHAFAPVKAIPVVKKPLEDSELPAVDTTEDYQLITHSRIMLGARDFLHQRTGMQSPAVSSRLDSIIQSTSDSVSEINCVPEANSEPTTLINEPSDAPNTVEVNLAQAVSRAESSEPRNHIQELSEECRIVSFGNMTDSGCGHRARLEYRQNSFWLPVMLYEINEDTSVRHQYHLNGSRKTRKIDLPPAKARQMAKNDLNKNWQQYIDSFLKQQ